MTHCNEAMERVSAALLGGEPRNETVARHLEDCPSCRDEARELERIWRRVQALPELDPGPGLRRRFEDMLAEEVARGRTPASPEGDRRDAPIWGDRLAAFWGRPAWGPALGSALVALMIGVLGGAFLVSRAPDPQVESLQAQVGALHEMVALSLLEQDSASRRLQGVRHGTVAGGPQPPLQDALVRAVDRDPNANVRLAALDALAPVASETTVMNRLLRSLPRQESPLVQIAMIDVLLQADGAQARRVVEQLAEDPDLPDEVRRHVHSRLGDET